MCNRKYREYLIKIEYQNGNTETIEYLDERKINSSNYKEMLSVYRETKQQYEGTSCTILFMGNNGEECVEMFSKTFESNIELVGDTTKGITEDISSIVDNLNRIKLRFKNNKEMSSVADKKVSEIYHTIESNIGSYVDNNYKINRYNELENALLDRRKIKHDLSLEKMCDKFIERMLQECNEINENICRGIIYSKTCKEEIQKGEGSASDTNTIKEYPYKNYKDKINLTKQLLVKFDKVVDDEDNMRLCCYNKVHKNR